LGGDRNLSLFGEKVRDGARSWGKMGIQAKKKKKNYHAWGKGKGNLRGRRWKL